MDGQPAGQNYPTDYISIRVTLDHHQWPRIRDDLIKEQPWYLCYPHKGKKQANEHFHIIVPIHVGRDGEPVNDPKDKYRKRLKTMGISGNQSFCIKIMHNTVLAAIQYCSHENTVPYKHGELVQDWIEQAPEWVNHYDVAKPAKPTGVKKADDAIKVTAWTVLRYAWQYRQSAGIISDELDYVWAVMLSSGKYYPDISFLKRGTPKFMEEVFKESCAKGRLVWSKTHSSNFFRAHNPMC